jgi:serine/threonine protein kinase
MGDVFKARQRGTDRIVAVKMVRADWAGRMQPDELRAAISQFHTEIKAAARLQHARIVHVFHMGEVGDQPFFVMEHVDGESLADRIQRDGPLSNREATETMAAVADAVHDAHQHGILHRDIKPQNILVESTSGEPKIADFGLATLQADDDASSHGKVDWDAVVETIPYMAPELFGGGQWLNRLDRSLQPGGHVV